MSWRRLEEHGGLRWPCPTEDHPGTMFLHGRLWQDPVEGPRAPFLATEWVPPVDTLSDEFPYRLTTGRHLDSYNTGVQTGAYSSPRRSAGMLEVSSHDATRLRLRDGDPVVVTSRRGSIQVPARVDDALREGLVFMTLHHPELADVNLLTIDAWDPRSGTSEFKATAVRIEPVTVDA